MTVCPRCSWPSVVRFETSGRTPAARVSSDRLPAYCQNCGLIMVDGEPIQLPEVLERAARELAATQDDAVTKVRKRVEDDPDRLGGYLRNLYRTAYMDGFFRALGFARFQQKEGRLRRLRELWRRRMARDADSIGLRPEHVLVAFPRDLYTELGELLELGAPPGETNASDSENKDPPRQTS